MLKAAVKEIAAREGLVATFMGRPFADQGGSGFHLHLSLQHADGHNAFGDDGARRAQPARRELRRRRDRPRAGAAGAARADGQRVQAHPAGQPRADPRELGSRQPHRVLPRSERAWLAVARRDPQRRRVGVRAPDHGGVARRGARRDRARARAARAGRRRRLPHGRRARGDAAPGRPRRGPRRARGATRGSSSGSARSSSRRSSR